MSMKQSQRDLNTRTSEKAVQHWREIRLVEEFLPVLSDPVPTALVWFAVTCLGRIRHVLVPDAIRLADVIEGHAEGREDRQTVAKAYQAFLQAHYTPRIVRSQCGTEDI